MAQYIASTLFDEKIQQTTYKVELVIEIEDVDGIEVPMEKVVWIEIENGEEIRHTTQPETSVWRRFNENVYSVLPIESQL